MDFDFQFEARETILMHASERLIGIEADLKRAESRFALKREALAQLGDECMVLRHAFREGSLATLYFRRAFDLRTATLDPLNDRMTIPVAAATAGPVPLRTYHSGMSRVFDVCHSLTTLSRDSVSGAISPYPPAQTFSDSASKILYPPWFV